MDFSDVVRRRRMVRDYQDRPVGRQVLDAILGTATRAPSAGFTQGWSFVVLEGPDTERFWRHTLPAAERPSFRWPGLLRAPVLVLPLASRQAYLDRYAEPDKGWTDRDPARWPVPYWHVDVGMASLLMLLTAVDAGLGALFFGVPQDRWADLGPALDVPEAYTAVGAIALGYAAPDEPSPSLKRGRRPMEQVVHRGRFGPARR